VNVVSPKLVPCTVTLADPVPARFRRVVMLRLGSSIDHASVTLPTCSPAVSITRRVPRTPWLVRQRTDVSDHHPDASHAVSVTRIAAEYVASPKFDPCTVTLADPVPARFRRVVMLSIGVSIDHASVTVPTRSPVVNIIRRVPRTPCDVRQCTNVSDHHSVDSHAVSVNRTASVYVVSPKLLPCTVTLTDPVPARFAEVEVQFVKEDVQFVQFPSSSPSVAFISGPHRTLKNVRRYTALYDSSSVVVPVRSPVVNIIRRVPRTPCDVRQRTDDSDHHSVDSHAVSMTRIASVYVASPKLLPCTVTLADPVPARFAPVVALSIGVSNDQTSVCVPARCPAVTDTLLVPNVPRTVPTRTDVSDSHSVASPAVKPTRMLGV
jgi:hypothetical protein